MRQRQLHAQVAVGLLMEAVQEGERDGASCRRVEGGMELPVELPPLRHVARPERRGIAVEDVIRLVELVGR